MSAVPYSPSRPISRTRSAYRVFTATRMTMFVTVLGVSYFSSSMVGSVMLERERMARKVAMEGTSLSTIALTNVKREVERLSEQKAVSAWAKSHGFVAAIDLPKSSLNHGLLADNR